MTIQESFYEPELTENKSDQEKIEYAVGFIKNTEKIKTLVETNQILKYEEGVYVQFEELEIESIAEKLLDSCTTHIRKEVINKLKALTACSINDFNSDFTKLVLNNGTLDLDTGIITEHNPEFLTTVKIPITYDETATCPMFVKFLVDAVGTKENIITIIESMSNILMANRINLEITMMFIGDGGAGKSTLSKIIRGVIGPDNCSSVSIHAMQYGRFDLAQLEGKLCNMGTDISNKELTNMGRFKQVVSGDPVQVERKNQHPHDMVSFAKHFYSANEMPNILDNSDAMFRRLNVIKFDNDFASSSERILDYDKVILEKEASGIFNLMLQNYRTLLRNKKFRYPQSIASVKETVKRESDKLREFKETTTTPDPVNYITNDEFYHNYVKWCQFKGYEILSQRILGSRLPSYGLRSVVKYINKKTTRIWSGITWNMENEWIKDNIKKEVLL